MPAPNQLQKRSEGPTALTSPPLGANRHPGVMQEGEEHDANMSCRATSQLHPAQSCDILLPTCYNAHSKEVLLQYFYYNSRESTRVCHAMGTPVHNLEQELEGENGLKL